MKDIKSYLIACAIFTGILVMGCDKKEVLSAKTDKIETKKETSIVELKTFFAKLINAKEGDISYDEKTGQFKLWGIDQVSKSQLITIYENSKK